MIFERVFGIVLLKVSITIICQKKLLFIVKFVGVGLVKPVNRYTSNEFHDWQRMNLPGSFVMQDVDTWVLVWSGSNTSFEPMGLVELKRSTAAPIVWTPYEADLPNYLALKKLADKASLPLWVVYFMKDQVITDTSQFHLFKITKIDANASAGKKIEYVHKVVTAADFRKGFPTVMP